MFSLKKIFNKRWDNVNTTIILTILGLEIKIKKKYSIPSMYRQIATLNYFLNSCADIRQVKTAEGELRNVQSSCLNILNIVDKICKNNNLCYWLDAGTLLGCIRHNNFIPWDDDIDICMPRQDYITISTILKKKLANYQIRFKAEFDNNFQIRIIDKNNNAALDIFPMDSYIKSNLTREEKKEITKLIRKARECFDKKYPSLKIKTEKFNQLKLKLLDYQNKIVLKRNHPNIPDAALFYGIDFPYESANYLIYNHDEIFPLLSGEFEGHYYPIPNKSDYYLKNLYGEYMKFPTVIPNIEKYSHFGEKN